MSATRSRRQVCFLRLFIWHFWFHFDYCIGVLVFWSYQGLANPSICHSNCNWGVIYLPGVLFAKLTNPLYCAKQYHAMINKCPDPSRRCLLILIRHVSSPHIKQHKMKLVINKTMLVVLLITMDFQMLLNIWNAAFAWLIHVFPSASIPSSVSTIYTIILLISVGVCKLQVPILARSTREMYLTVRIV